MLDDDFVFAQNIFHYYSHLAAGDIHDDQPEIAVDGLNPLQAELRVEPYHLRHYVAHLGEQLPASFLDVARPYTANLLDKGERQRKYRAPAAHKKCLGNNQRERHLESETCALPFLGFYVD